MLRQSFELCYIIMKVYLSLILGSTAFHSLELGFRTIMIDDCSRGIDHGDIARTFERIREQNGLVVQSNEV